MALMNYSAVYRYTYSYVVDSYIQYCYSNIHLIYNEFKKGRCIFYKQVMHVNLVYYMNTHAPACDMYIATYIRTYRMYVCMYVFCAILYITYIRM